MQLIVAQKTTGSVYYTYIVCILTPEVLVVISTGSSVGTRKWVNEGPAHLLAPSADFLFFFLSWTRDIVKMLRTKKARIPFVKEKNIDTKLG